MINVNIDVNKMVDEVFLCRITENSFEIIISILLKIILFVDLVLQKEKGMMVVNRNILTQFVIGVLDDGSKIENKFVIIFNFFGMMLVMLV